MGVGCEDLGKGRKPLCVTNSTPARTMRRKNARIKKIRPRLIAASG